MYRDLLLKIVRVRSFTANYVRFALTLRLFRRSYPWPFLNKYNIFNPSTLKVFVRVTVINSSSLLCLTTGYYGLLRSIRLGTDCNCLLR